MKSKILGLRTAIYKVSDLEKGKAFYTNAFRVEPYFDEVYYVGYNVGGYELGVQPDETPSAIEKVESVNTFWGVNDIEAEYRHFLDCGATEVEKPMNVGGEIVVATLKDPWGNIIGLIYNPEFKLP